MDPDNERAERIGSLVNHSGYQELCQMVADQVERLSLEMADADEPGKFLRLGRLWQIARRFLHILQKTPFDMCEFLEQEKSKPSLDTLEDVFRDGQGVAPWIRQMALYKDLNEKLNRGIVPESETEP